MATNIGLKPGQKLCCSCKKEYLRSDVAHALDCPTSVSDDDYEPQEEKLQSFNMHLKYLNASPIKANSHVQRKVGKISYGKRKLEEVCNAVQAKCANVLGVPKETLDCIVKKDHESFVDSLKHKIQSTESKRERIKLLTLKPDSWTLEKTVAEFGVSKNLVRQAQLLKDSKGILAEPTTRKGRELPQETIDRVVEFYQSDEFSRMCPGKKEYVTIKNDRGERITKQKRLLLVNISELYNEYKKKNPEDKIGISKFFALGPKWCVSVAAPGAQSVCVCQIHQNAKLIVSSKPGINLDYKDVLAMVVCDINNRDCMLGFCKHCPGKEVIDQFLVELFESNEMEMDGEITYKQWGQTNSKCNLLTITATVGEFISSVSDLFGTLGQHHFTAKAQAAYLSSIKSQLSPEHAIVLLDYAENYSFVVQDAVQGYHWNNNQATLHPLVVYYKTTDGDLKCLNFCVISDCLKHDTVAVHAFLAVVLPHLKRALPFVNRLVYFSDGASSQYKNFKNFLNLCSHKSDFALEASWNFFATSHGKSPCDGIGGTVKRLATRASLQAPSTGQILTPKDMYIWAVANISGVQFFYLSSEDVATNAERYDLATRFSLGKTVAGTRAHHAFIPISQTELSMKRLSSDEDGKIVSIQAI